MIAVGRRVRASRCSATPLNALGNQNSDLEGLHALSPYHWASVPKPPENGFDASVGLLFAVAVVASAVAVLALAVAATWRVEAHWTRRLE